MYQNFDNFQSTHGFQGLEYLGKTEPERIPLLQAMLTASTVSIRFTPFLTGITTSSTFDMTGLRAEVDKHPECAMTQP